MDVKMFQVVCKSARLIFFRLSAKSAFFLSIRAVEMRCVTVSEAEVNRVVVPVFHCLHA